MMGKMGGKAIKRGVLSGNWGGEAIRLVQGGDEKPLIGMDTPVQLQSISYKGLFLLGWARREQIIRQDGTGSRFFSHSDTRC